MNVREVLGVSAAIAALHVASVVHGQTRVVYVDSRAPGGGNGNSWNLALNDLRAALARVSAGQYGLDVQVRVAGGMYRAPRFQEISTASSFTLTLAGLTSAASVQLFGGFAGRGAAQPDLRDFVATPSVLTADTLGNDGPEFTNREDNVPYTLRVETTYRSSAVVDGFTIQGAGAGDRNGAGVWAENRDPYWGGQLSLSNLTVRDNTTNYGAGIYGYSVTIRDCRIELNHADTGGGVDLTGGAMLDCVVAHNSARSGGGMSVWWARASRCVFAENSASETGGGIFGVGSFDNCLVVGNQAGIVGGGMALAGQLDNSTVCYNNAQWGGGAHVEPDSGTNGLGVDSSIFFGNTASQAGSQFSIGSGYLILNAVVAQGGLDDIFRIFDASVLIDQLLDADPHFVNPNGPDADPGTWADGDYRLQSDSAAIDAGFLGGFSDLYDLDGNDRASPGPWHTEAIVDIGCYEWHVTCIADWDYSGSTPDDRDIDLFFRSWRDGEARADVNHSGGAPDDADIYAFFDAWNAGC